MDPFDRGAPLGARWFSLPAAVATTVGIAGIFAYAIWMVEPSAYWARMLWVIAAVLWVVTVAGAEVRSRRFLGTWRRISEKTLTASVENLQSSAREAHGLPERLFMARLQHWVLLGTVVPILLRVTTDWVTVETMIRLSMMGLVAGPLVCLLPHFEMTRRSRALVSHIAGRGLTAAQLAQAIPPPRLRLRGRLLVFGLIVSAVPALLVADAATGQGRKHLEAVAQIADPVARLEASQHAITLLRVQVLGVAAGLLLLVGLLAAAVGKVMADPLERMAREARRVSEGRLSDPHLVVAEAELWTLGVSFAQMEGQLGSLLSQLKRAGVQISSTTEQIVVTSSKHESGAARQASALTQTSSTTEELARSARSIAENASSVAQIAQQTLQSAEQARSNAVTFSEAMERMKRGNQAISDSVALLNARLGQIGKIIEFINGIAEKSDLLALNAELEGVKAGEVGRAFSLVATEMRRMAENVTRSTQEIVELIDQIRDASTEAVRVTEAGMRTTESSTGIVEAMTHSLANIVGLAGQTSEAVKTISSSTQQQQAGTDQLAGAMGDILSVTQETEQATQAIIIANVDLVRLARELQDAVQSFEVADAVRPVAQA